MKRNNNRQIALMGIALLIATTIAAQESELTNKTSDADMLAETPPSLACIPPAISTQPTNLSSVRRGSMQTFSVSATGTGPLFYQWYKSGVPVIAIGTNSSSYVISSVGAADVGYYFVVVSNACGSDTSKITNLTLEPVLKASTVSCVSSAVPPDIIPIAYHPCDGNITGVLESVTDSPNPLVGEGTRVYKYSYTSKGGCVAYWEYTYTIRYSGILAAPANTTSSVSSLAEAADPGAPADITDACDRKISAVLVGSSTPQSNDNIRIWTYRYTACDCKTTADWTHTYTVDSSASPAKPPASIPLNTSGTGVSPDTPEKSACIMNIPNGFSPNGDGMNDYFLVTCIENYPDAKLTIYSRATALLYEQEHYGNLDFWGGDDAAWWKGTDRYKNELSSGTYIYVLDLLPGKNEPVKTGYVFISR